MSEEKKEARIEILSTTANYNPTTNELDAKVKVKYSVQAAKYTDIPALDENGVPRITRDGKPILKRIYDRHFVTSTFVSKGLLVDFVKRAMTTQPLLIKVQGANRGLTAEKAKELLDGKTFSDVPRTRIAVRTPAEILAGVAQDAELMAEMSAEEKKALASLLAKMAVRK
jgi:hypothetical protein